MSEEYAKLFLNKMNDKNIQIENKLISKLSQNGKCDFDYLTKEQFDFLKYQYLKEINFFGKNYRHNDIFLIHKYTNTHLNHLNDRMFFYEGNHLKSVFLQSNKSYFDEIGIFWNLINENSSNIIVTKNRKIHSAFDNLFNDIIIDYENFNTFNDKLYKNEKTIYGYPIEINNKVFKGIFGNKKIFTKKLDSSEKLDIKGYSLYKNSKENILLDYVKTFFDETAFISGRDLIIIFNGKDEINSKVKNDSINNIEFELNNDSGSKPESISDLQSKHKEFIDGLRSKQDIVTDDPFTHGLLLVRKCK